MLFRLLHKLVPCLSTASSQRLLPRARHLYEYTALVVSHMDGVCSQTSCKLNKHIYRAPFDQVLHFLVDYDYRNADLLS